MEDYRLEVNFTAFAMGLLLSHCQEDVFVFYKKTLMQQMVLSTA
jgi:hypothetical protein